MVATSDEKGGFLGLIASGFFFVGINALVWGDNSQTSLKTVSLLALSALVAVPLYNASIGYIFWYCLFGLLWLWLLYQVTCQPKEKSRLQQTYRRDMDTFPHWLCCLLPSLAGTFCIYLLVDGGKGLGQCRETYGTEPLACTDLFLQLLSVMIAATAFAPQVYLIVFQVWGYDGETLKVKVKVFMSCMFVCYSLWAAMWAWQNSELVLDPDTWGNAVASQIFLYFLVANAVTLVVIASPWIYRSTCLQCCGSCVTSRSGRKDGSTTNTPGGALDVATPVNTGLNNDAEPEKESNAWYSSSPWTSITGSSINKNKSSDDDIETTTPAVIGNEPYLYSPGCPAVTTTSTAMPAATSNNQWGGGANATPEDNGTPDWLQ